MKNKNRYIARAQWAVFIGMGVFLSGCLPEDSSLEHESSSQALTGPGRIRRAEKKVPGEYIVLLKDGSTLTKGVSAQAVHATADSLMAKHGGSKKFVFNRAIRGFSARMTEAAAQALAANPSVDIVEENAEVRANAVQANPIWGLDRVDQRVLPLSQSYDDRSLTGAGVTVYVIDTGIRTTHVEFEGRASVGADFIGDGQNGQDGAGHGTHVAGTIASKTYGVAKQAKVVAVRVLNNGGFGTRDTVIAGIDWVTANHVNPAVANMSLGGGASVIEDAALRNSIASGVVYVVAAGNDASDVLGSPARVSETLVVGATDTTDTRATFSNFGAGVDLFAPGVNILSTFKDSNTSTKVYQGTSMAAPHVAGLAALYRQAAPSASVAAIHDLIVGAATVGKVINPGAGTPNRLAYIAHDSSILFGDTFESGTTTQWTSHGGTWAIATDGNKVYQGTNTAGYARASAGSTSWTDQIVEARLKAVSWSGSDRFMLLANRFVDINNYYYVALRSSGKIELKRLKANAATTLASKSFTVSTGTWYKVKLEAIGSSLKVYVNDTLQLSATDTSFPTGKIAMGAYYGKVNFDDVVVTPSGSAAGTASNPYPASPSTGINPRLTLTWMPGEMALSHDVYFGTSSSPPLIGNQTATSYTPATLANNTTYYWRINARSATGAVLQGPLWTFTTGSAPGLASAPTPGNGSTNVSITPTLAWTAGAGTTEHRVYLWNANDWSLSWETAEPQLVMADVYSLDHSTTYSWRVDEVNGQFTTPGPVWTFTTGNPQGLPGFATNPIPAVAASNVGTLPTLKWTAGANAVSHRVYLTEGFTEPALLSTQSGTSHTVAVPLLAESQYWWRVDEVDAQGRVTTGRYWSFITGKPAGAPGRAVNISPEANIFGVGLNTPLTWSAASGATSYDVLVQAGEFWDEGVPVIYATTGTSLTLPPLNPGWEYLWCVNARNAVAASRGSCTIFTTLSDPSVPPPTATASNPIPANNATGVNFVPTLTFVLPSNATAGIVYFGTSPTELGYEGGRLSRFSPGELEPNTKYYWRVDALNQGGSKRGTVWSFTTGPRTLPQATSNPQPTNGATGVSLNPRLSWTVGEGTTGHVFYFGTTNPPSQIWAQGYDPYWDDSEYWPPTLLPFTKYYWRVDAQNVVGTTQGTVWSFTTGDSPPDSASNPSPQDGATEIGTMPLLTWSAAARATSYEVHIGLKNGLPELVSTQTGTSYQVTTPLLSGTEYTWQIISKNAAGQAASAWNFTTALGEGNGPALNPNPANNSYNHPTSLTLSWTPGQGAVSHDVYMAVETRDAWTKVSTQTGTTYATGLLLSNTNYYWRVDERDAQGNVIVGPEWIFSTGIPANLAGEATNPNPIWGAVLIGTQPTLTWTAGAGTTEHLIYFGEYALTSGLLPALVRTQTGTSFAPGTLKPNTRYIWIIGEKNANGIRRSETWSFTTGDSPFTYPDPSTNPVPTNGVGNVTLTPSLSWTAGAGATSHDVYFGTSPTPALVGNQTATTYSPGTLLPLTTYYWRVDERNAAGPRLGVTWQFTTAAGGPTSLLNDDFEDGNSTGWTNHDGSWSVVTDGTKVFRGSSTTGYARSSAGLSTWTNQVITARVKPISWSGTNRFVVVFGRFQDVNNYYYLAMRSNNTIELKKLSGGGVTTFGSKALTVTAGTWYDVKLEIVGTNIKAYVNGVLQLSATDSQFSTGKAGVGGFYSTVEFDDIVVTQ